MIDLDRERCVAAFEGLGLHGVDEMLGLYRQKEPFLSVETGRIPVGEFYDRLRSIIGSHVPDATLGSAFEAFLVCLPVERLAALRRLRSKGYRTFMISNTNAIMYDGWIKRAFMQEGLRVGDYFDGIVTSFAEGVCKPDAELFATVLRRHGLKAEECLLLDDSEANSEAARLLGMKAVRIFGDRDFVTVADNELRCRCKGA